jgi:hypothetical protein
MLFPNFSRLAQYFLRIGSTERAECLLLEIVSLQPAFIEAWELLFTCLSDVEAVMSQFSIFIEYIFSSKPSVKAL